MTAPSPEAPPLLTEAEYKKLYDLINNELHTAIHSFYTLMEIKWWAAESRDNLQKLNTDSIFWITQLNALQTTYFIVLGRLFDDDSRAHSIHKLLAATVGNPQLFSKAALAERRTEQNNGIRPDYLDKYLTTRWEPTTSELRGIKKMVVPFAQKFKDIYEDIRNQVYAHKQIDADVKQLFVRTQVGHIDDILFGLRHIMQILLEMYDNGLRYELPRGLYDFGYRREIREATRNVLGSLT
jgi:hypothetical protein